MIVVILSSSIQILITKKMATRIDEAKRLMGLEKIREDYVSKRDKYQGFLTDTILSSECKVEYYFEDYLGYESIKEEMYIPTDVLRRYCKDEIAALEQKINEIDKELNEEISTSN